MDDDASSCTDERVRDSATWFKRSSIPLSPSGERVVDVASEACEMLAVVTSPDVATGLFASLSSVLVLEADVVDFVNFSTVPTVELATEPVVVASATNGKVVSAVGDADDDADVTSAEDRFPVCTSMLLYFGQPATTLRKNAVAVRSKLRSLADFLKMHFSGGSQLNRAQRTVPLSCTLTVATLQSSRLQHRSTHSCSFPDLVGSMRLTLAPEALETVSSRAWPVCHTPGGSHWFSALSAVTARDHATSSSTTAAVVARRRNGLDDVPPGPMFRDF